MHKSVKWSSFANADFANLLEYLELRWNKKVCTDFTKNLDYCIYQIEKKS